MSNQIIEEHIEDLKAQMMHLKRQIDHPEEFPNTTWYVGKIDHLNAHYSKLEKELNRWNSEYGNT